MSLDIIFIQKNPIKLGSVLGIQFQSDLGKTVKLNHILIMS